MVPPLETVAAIDDDSTTGVDGAVGPTVATTKVDEEASGDETRVVNKRQKAAAGGEQRDENANATNAESAMHKADEDRQQSRAPACENHTEEEKDDVAAATATTTSSSTVRQPPPSSSPPPPQGTQCCAGCGASEAHAGRLLLFEDPEKDDDHREYYDKHQQKDERTAAAEVPARGEEESEERYCAGCMVGKRVRVFWPVDSRWYIAHVQRYDASSDEHLLQYPDGDTEYVHIGEDHTTNIQYREYVRHISSMSMNEDTTNNNNNNSISNENTTGAPLPMEQQQGIQQLHTLPSFTNGGLSFALSAMSQGGSFGMLAAVASVDAEEHEKLKLLTSSSSRGGGVSFQHLPLDRTASSMSSFGMYGTGGGGADIDRGEGSSSNPITTQLPPPLYQHQTMSPNFTHSFSSKIGTTLSMDFGPPPPPSAAGGEQHNRHGTNVFISPGGGTRDGPPRHQQWSNNGYDSRQYPNYYNEAGSGHYPYHQQHQSTPPLDQKRLPKALSSTKKSRVTHHVSSSAIVSSSSIPPPSNGGGSSSGGRNEGGDKSRKALAKAWTKIEDEYLLDLVLQMQHPLKWSVIAQSLSDYAASIGVGEVGEDGLIRSGKQCRERYVNHLNPRLKSSEFTALEDATIWRLYATVGSQWAKMSKVIPGRTDNNLKNRFHNLKRQLIREEDGRLRSPEPEGYARLVHVDRVRDIPAYLRTKIEDMWKHQRNIGLVAAESILHSVSSLEESNHKLHEKDGGMEEREEEGLRRFGPYELVTHPIQCGRCGLLLPSVHCGNEICTRTRWCKVCTKVSMHLTGNVLRECLNLRKIQNPELIHCTRKLLKDVWDGR